MYKVNPVCYSEMFAIPASVADTYLAEASGEAVKVLLRLFRAPSSAISVSALSEALSISADAVLCALDFWVQKGILLFTDETGNVKFVPKSAQPVNPVPAAASPASRPAAHSGDYIPKPTMEQIANRIKEDETVRSLFTEAQVILGRTIGLDMQTALLTLFDTYGLCKEVLLTLLQHLSETGKGSTATVLRIGKIWAQHEINTLDDANAYIQKDGKVQRLFTEFRTMTGISNPRPTQKQSEFLLSWMDMGFSAELIVKAYEETVERTGKLSFPYMDKILKNWNQEGLKSLEAIAAQRKKAAAAKQKSSDSPSYDMNRILQELI